MDSVVLTILGIVFLGSVPVNFLYTACIKRRCDTPARATVVDILEIAAGTALVPLHVFSYTAGGQIIRSSNALVSSDKKSELLIGGVVEIRYNSARPTEFILSGKPASMNLVLAAAIVLLGAAMVVRGVTG